MPLTSENTDSNNIFYPKNQTQGYNLIQMSIALLILGIMATGFLQIYRIYKEQQDYIKTQDAVSQAVQKLQTFRQTYGYYPCPAPLDVARDNPTYGNPSNCSVTTQASGTCVLGICIQTTTRTIGGVATPIRVRTGGIPFRALQMDEKDTFDAYGSRLTYVLTENMGVDGLLNEQRGGIEIVDDLGTPLTDPPQSAAFLILSHGKNKVGAIPNIGGPASVVCPTGAAAVGQMDAENCINPASIAGIPRFINTLRVEGTGAKFDDILEYFATAENKLWRRAAAAGGIENITNISPQAIGVGDFSEFSPPPASTRMAITQTTVDLASGRVMTPNNPAGMSGALEARNAFLTADSFCTKDGTKCYRIADFALSSGSTTLDECNPAATGEYPVGITSDGTKATALCREIAFQCPAGKAITGINADGSPNCETAVPVCNAMMDTICGHTVPIDSSTVIGLKTPLMFDPSPVSPDTCGRATWTCTGGTWVKDGSQDTPAHCNNAPISSAPCPDGYEGTTFSLTCGGISMASCTCKGIDPHTVPVPCDAPFTGSDRTKVCSSKCNADGVLMAEVCTTPTGSCTCDLTDKVEFADCPTGYKRKDSPTPAAFASSPWPTDPKKGKYRTLTIDTSSCTYNTAAFNDSNCECDPAPAYEKVLRNPSDYPKANPDYVVHEACYTAKEGTRNVYDDGVLALENVGYGYAVMKTPKTTSCTLDTAHKSEISPPTFVPRKYRWKANGSPLATNTEKSGKEELDTPCNCQSFAGAKTTCYQSRGGGAFDIYSCECKGD